MASLSQTCTFFTSIQKHGGHIENVIFGHFCMYHYELWLSKSPWHNTHFQLSYRNCISNLIMLEGSCKSYVSLPGIYRSVLTKNFKHQNTTHFYRKKILWQRLARNILVKTNPLSLAITFWKDFNQVNGILSSAMKAVRCFIVVVV